jgi:hypothetical protein
VKKKFKKKERRFNQQFEIVTYKYSRRRKNFVTKKKIIGGSFEKLFSLD